MQKKTIFLLPFPPPQAGPEAIAYELVNSETIKQRNDVIIINSSLKNSNKDKGKFDLVGLKRFFCIVFQLLKNFRKVDTVFMYFSSSKVGYFKDSIYILLCRLFRKKCIAQYHGANFHNFYNSQSNKYKKYIEFSLGKLNKLLVLGNDIKPLFNNIYFGKIEILYNGLNLKKYSIVKPEKENIPFTIFFMGHLIYSKGFHLIVKAYKDLYKKYGNKISFKFAGENIGFQKGTLEFLNGKWEQDFLMNGEKINAEIQSFINNSKNFNAEYLGVISGNNKLNVLNKIDILVQPSFTEGFSMSVLEAMSVRKSVIVTPVGAMLEVVKNEENGLITPIGNAEELKKNIEKLYEDKNLYNKISKNNVQYIKKNFDIELIASKLLSILNKT
ncbi:MAG: glycosyltransferase family 4 protein [Bacteroidetes bacterium]|nr:glycosyltransferase family 4 protein [Bacteroidota bacterium]